VHALSSGVNSPGSRRCRTHTGGVSCPPFLNNTAIESSSTPFLEFSPDTVHCRSISSIPQTIMHSRTAAYRVQYTGRKPPRDGKGVPVSELKSWNAGCERADVLRTLPLTIKVATCIDKCLPTTFFSCTATHTTYTRVDYAGSLSAPEHIQFARGGANSKAQERHSDTTSVDMWTN
jgi:hypothetical protein